MVCEYFIEDYLGFCGAATCSYAPRISEMEELCFKNFHACRIYEKYEASHAPVEIRELPTECNNEYPNIFHHLLREGRIEKDDQQSGPENRKTTRKGTKIKKQFVVGIVGIVIMIASFISVHAGDAFAQGERMTTGGESAQATSLGSALHKQNADPTRITKEIPQGYMLSAKGHNDRGIMYSEKGEYDLALAEFNKALEISPHSAETYNNRGIAYSRKRAYDHAIADFTKALELNPNSVKAYYNRAIIYVVEGHVNFALLDFKKCLDLDPANAAVYEARGTLLVGLACSDWGVACHYGNCTLIREGVKIGLCNEPINPF